MSSEDQRNTLITELTARTNRPVNHYQEMSDYKLAGAGAVLVLLRSGQMRADTDLKKMSDEDARNTAIVEINTQTGVPIDQLQAFSNLALVSVAVTGNPSAARTLDFPPTTPAPLPNPVNGPLHFDTGPLTSNEPLGGSAHFVVERNGNFTLTTHAHDSGFNNIRYALGVTLLCPNGQAAFGAGVKGHVEGTIAGLPFGTPDRNDDQTILGNDPRITALFDSIVAGSSLHGRLDGEDTFVGGIQDAIGEAFTDGAKAFGVELGKGLAVIVLKGGTTPGEG